MNPIIGLLQLLSVGLILYLFILIIYTMWGLTHPHRQTYASAMSKKLPGDPSELDNPLEYEERVVTGSRGKIYTWIIKGKKIDGPTVVMTHGWGSSRLGGLKRLSPIVDLANEVILWDLPGHGDSQGITNLGSSEHHDLKMIIEQCVDADSKGVVLYGWSMGAGVSLAAATENKDAFPIIGVICESPYILPQTPALNVIKLRGVPYRFNVKPAIQLIGILFGVGRKWNGFPRDEICKQVNQPVLIIHGDQDPVCPISDGQQISDSAPNSKMITIEGGGHNNLWTDSVFVEQMKKTIASFLKQLDSTSN
ncbi:MAG: alpha/beta hydrolase [Phycisphaerales bacterium]|nr:alpha/beta hydrolase [Phycisphaerales bacterium]